MKPLDFIQSATTIFTNKKNHRSQSYLGGVAIPAETKISRLNLDIANTQLFVFKSYTAMIILINSIKIFNINLKNLFKF